MTDKTVYWIWLQRCLGTDSRKLVPAIEKFGDAEKIFRCDERTLFESGIFSGSEMEKLLQKDMDYSEKTLERCQELGIKATGYGESGYPARLAAIPTPPVVIYTAGTLPSEDELHIGIVGTRNPDETGKQLSYNFAYDLARNNTVIVSGGAYGIDIFAHRGCVESGGKTLCVIACGIDRLQSRVSEYLLDNIPLSGAIISEYPPGYPPTKFTFPIRDRIISGLSDGTLVVQAGLGSGALITVKYAISQKRKIFAVPGSCGHIFSTGTNYLIRSGFATALTYRDILSFYNGKILPQSGDESVNPALAADFYKKLAVKAEGYILPSYSGRKLAVPDGYSLFSDDPADGRESVAAEEQLLLPFEEETAYSDIFAEKDDALPEKPTEKPEAPDVSSAETEETEEKEETEETAETEETGDDNEGGFVHLELFSRNRRFYSGNREEEMELLRALRKRALNGEPEPRGSYIYKLCENTNASVEYVRLKEIDNLTKRLHTGEGVHTFTREKLDRLFGRKDSSANTDAPKRPGPIRIPDLNNFDEYDEKEERVKPDKNVRKKRTERSEKNKKQNVQKNKPIIEQKDETEQPDTKKSKKISSEQLTENACSVYDTISETPIHVDNIKLQTGLEIGSVLSALTELQISGLVKKLPGSRYVRI